MPIKAGKQQCESKITVQESPADKFNGPHWLSVIDDRSGGCLSIMWGGRPA